MSNQNVPWANRGRGGSGVGRGGAGRGGSAEEPSNGDAGADGEEKKASPFGERVKRPGSPAAPVSSAAAPEEAAASKPSSGLAASSPFGERVRRSTANSIDSNARPLAGSSPAATTTTTTTTATATAAPGSPSVPAKAAPSSPFGARVAAKPNPIAITTPAAASEKPTLAAVAGIGSPSPLLKAAIEKSATTQEDEQDDSSGDETDILKRRPRKEKIVYSPEDKQGEPSQEVIESLIPRLEVGDVSSSVEESGSVSARLPPKASLLSVETDTMRKRSLTAPAMRESDEASDAEVEVSEQERKLATESAFGEGSSRQRSGTENMTVVEYLSSATKDAPRLRSATKQRVVPKAGLRKKPTRRRSSIASSNRAALLKSDRSYCSMELFSIPMTESSSFAACDDGGAMTNSEDLSAVEEVNDDSKAGRGTLKTTGRRFTLSAEDLAKAQLKRKTSSPEQPRPAPVVNAEETVGMLSRLKKSTSAITVKEEKEEAPLPAFGSGLKKVGTKTPASNNETTSPAAAAPTPGFALKKAASTTAVNKTEEKKDETPSPPFGQLKKTSAPPKEETKPEPAAAPAATGPAWAKNLKKNAEAPKEEEKPKEAPAPAPAAAATGPAWAKNLKKNTEAAKEEPAPVAVAAAPAVTNSPAWAKKKSGEAAPKEEEKPKEAAAPAAASNSPAWARNLKKPATAAAEPAKEEEKKEPAPSSASNSPAWAKKKAAAEPVKEESKPAPAPAESSNSPAWAKNLKKPTTVAAAPAVAAVAAEEDKSKVATPPWARKNTAPKEEEKPAPAAASATAAAPATSEAAGGSVSAAAAMFGGRGRGSGVGSGVARGGKFS